MPKGGAEFNEVYRTIQRMDPKDPSSWWVEWQKLGEYVEATGDRAAAEGRRITARDAYRRAANYYYAAQMFPSHGDAANVRLRLLEQHDKCFAKAAAFFEPAFRRVHVPFNNGVLGGYLYRTPSEDAPVLLRPGGHAGWLFSEVLWAADHGASTLAFYERMPDGQVPAEGFVRPESERAIGAAIDHVETIMPRPRVVLVGLSDLSAHLCLRAAAFEKRVRAVACIDGWYDLPSGAVPPAAAASGSRPVPRVPPALAGHSLKGILAKVTCPVLTCYTVGDPEVDVAAIERIHAELGGPKLLKRWTAADYVIAHNGVDNPAETFPYIVDWCIQQAQQGSQV
jgi:hypothetical protein